MASATTTKQRKAKSISVDGSALRKFLHRHKDYSRQVELFELLGFECRTNNLQRDELESIYIREKPAVDANSPESIGNWLPERLQELIVQKCQLPAVPMPLPYTLVLLDLQGNELTEIHLPALPRLKALTLSDNKLTDAGWRISHDDVPSLEKLEVDGNRELDAIATLARFPTLKHARITNDASTSREEAIAHFNQLKAALTKLETVDGHEIGDLFRIEPEIDRSWLNESREFDRVVGAETKSSEEAISSDREDHDRRTIPEDDQEALIRAIRSNSTAQVMQVLETSPAFDVPASVVEAALDKYAVFKLLVARCSQKQELAAILHRALRSPRHYQQCEALVKAGADVAFRGQHGDNALHIAIRVRVPEYVDLVVRRDAALTAMFSKNNHGETAWSLAAASGMTSYLRKLEVQVLRVLEASGADIVQHAQQFITAAPGIAEKLQPLERQTLLHGSPAMLWAALLAGAPPTTRSSEEQQRLAHEVCARCASSVGSDHGSTGEMLDLAAQYGLELNTCKCEECGRARRERVVDFLESSRQRLPESLSSSIAVRAEELDGHSTALVHALLFNAPCSDLPHAFVRAATANFSVRIADSPTLCQAVDFSSGSPFAALVFAQSPPSVPRYHHPAVLRILGSVANNPTMFVTESAARGTLAQLMLDDRAAADFTWPKRTASIFLIASAVKCLLAARFAVPSSLLNADRVLFSTRYHPKLRCEQLHTRDEDAVDETELIQSFTALFVVHLTGRELPISSVDIAQLDPRPGSADAVVKKILRYTLDKLATGSVRSTAQMYRDIFDLLGAAWFAELVTDLHRGVVADELLAVDDEDLRDVKCSFDAFQRMQSGKVVCCSCSRTTNSVWDGLFCTEQVDCPERHFTCSACLEGALRDLRDEVANGVLEQHEHLAQHFEALLVCPGSGEPDGWDCPNRFSNDYVAQLLPHLSQVMNETRKRFVDALFLELQAKEERVRQEEEAKAALEQTLHSTRAEAEKQRKLLNSAATLRLTMPETWSDEIKQRMANPRPYFETVPIHRSSTAGGEFEAIETIIKLTIPGGSSSGGASRVRASNILRVHNSKLWQEYCVRKEMLRRRENGSVENLEGSRYLQAHKMLTPLLDPTVNEYWAFHCCSWEVIDTLAQDGYDPRVARLGGRFGAGFYLADSSAKSFQYCMETATAGVTRTKILLYRITLGDVWIHKSGNISGQIRRPPEKKSATGVRSTYDSLMAESSEFSGATAFRELVIFERGQAYLEYIVDLESPGGSFKSLSSNTRVDRTPLQAIGDWFQRFKEMTWGTAS